jgi:hypothetical protein
MMVSYDNVGKLAAHTKIHAETLHQMSGPNGNPTASNLFQIVAYLQQAEGVRCEVRSTRAVLRAKRRPSPQRRKRAASTALSY